ncbi:MAG: hypothetical protein ACOCQH_03850 [Halanaerobiales bacterium]
MEEIIEDFTVGSESCQRGGKNKIPFCCVQVVPGNLEIDEDKLKKDDLEITFTPKLECCVTRDVVICSIGGTTCEIEANVMRLVGCIEYALSTLDNSDPISGQCGNEAVAACCSSTVCVNQAVLCSLEEIECPENMSPCQIKAKLNDAVVEECEDKKIIKFTGKFIICTGPC